MIRRSICLLVAAATLAATACMEYGPHPEEHFEHSGRGLFILCEGNFMYGTASLSYYDPERCTLENELFLRVNGEKLGDTAQSMTLLGERGFIVVNNSGRVSVVNTTTLQVVGEIGGLISPRYVHFVSAEKGYITDLYAERITLFDPSTLAVTGYIPTPGHPSTEQMAQVGDYLFVACWSYDDCVLVIDTRSDQIVETIRVGVQPAAVVADCNGKVWCLTDGGGYPENPAGYEPARLCRIDPLTFAIDRSFTFPWGEAPSKLCTDREGRILHFIAGDVWRMAVDAEILPERPFLARRGTRYYGLGVDPDTSEVYVADAIDYAQSGVVYRFSADAVPLDTLRVGVIPGAFCFKTSEPYQP